MLVFLAPKAMLLAAKEVLFGTYWALLLLYKTHQPLYFQLLHLHLIHLSSSLAISQESSSYGGRVKRVLCRNCHVLANRFISTTEKNNNCAFHKCPYLAVCVSFSAHILCLGFSFVVCSQCVDGLAFRLEDVSIISGRMKWWTLECKHLMPLLQFIQFPYKQWHHLVVSLLLHWLSGKIKLLEWTLGWCSSLSGLKRWSMFTFFLLCMLFSRSSWVCVWVVMDKWMYGRMNEWMKWIFNDEWWKCKYPEWINTKCQHITTPNETTWHN